jgi:methionyl aminopeptidase
MRPLQDGDIVNIDVTVYRENFHADLNETYLVGNVDEKGRKLVQVTKECLDKAIDISKLLHEFFIVDRDESSNE